MKKLWIGLAVTAGIILLLGVTCVGKYNSLVDKEEGVDAFLNKQGFQGNDAAAGATTTRTAAFPTC